MDSPTTNNHNHIHTHHLNGASTISQPSKKPKLLSSSFITPAEIHEEFSHHDPSVARINNGSFGCCPASSMEAYVTRAGGHVIEVPLPFPVASNEEIVREFRKALERGKSEGKRIRLAVIDHVTSMPCVVIPVKELVQICREEGVEKVFIDAAHSIGCVDVDMEEIGADFYTSNLHKWFFCPPSIAFLYTRKTPKGGSELHHPVVSHEYGNGLAVESAWIGTRDYSAQLVVPAALEFVNRFQGGIEGIKKRNHDAVVEMGEMLAQSWGTHLGSPPDMCGSMIMVGLPTSLGIACDDDALGLRVHLREQFGVEVPIYYRPPRDGEVGCVTGYARISHQVYNKLTNLSIMVLPVLSFQAKERFDPWPNGVTTGSNKTDQVVRSGE
ncbi:hypothetical protein Ahy_A06g027278 [Arachis hypogaea]|uniref:Aminotransferase class V domain-containing protein n=1 Tax=Arachis hypogaea TaxID=3818 RepID=A0A445CN35_ARAHY|nr:hypothetical protein Ahy_A06g027278 [Arachis hypogaea]